MMIKSTHQCTIIIYNIGNSYNDGNSDRSKNDNTTKIFMTLTACIAFIVIFRMSIIKVIMHIIFIIVNT